MSQEPSETQITIFQTLEKRLNGIIGVTRFDDDSSGKFVDVLQCRHPQSEDLLIYSTIGTSKLPVRIFDDGRSVGVEVLAIGRKAYPELEDIVATCGLDLLGLYQEIEPGGVHENAVAQLFPDFEMKHIYFAHIPEYLDEAFANINLETQLITWLLATPISDAEYTYLTENGRQTFDVLLYNSGVDITDLRRKSIM